MTSLMRDMTVDDPYIKIEDMMNKREESIAQAIEQRKSEIEQWNEKIKQNQDRYKEGSAARKQVDNRIKSLNDEASQLQDYLDGESLGNERHVLTQRAKFLQEMSGEKAVLQSENAAISAGRWRYQNM